MIQHQLPLNNVHESWHEVITLALGQVEPAYLQHLSQNQQWLPGPDNIFNAFSLPKQQIRYIMLGESPYPRAMSANGYAFWDNAVTKLWSETGLSKQVNRATSLRNFIKMLLISEGLLHAEDPSQPAIAAINKQSLVQTSAELFQNMLNHGFLLLNASLVLSDRPVAKDAKAWQPFLVTLLQQLDTSAPNPQLIMFGNIAKKIAKITNVEKFPTLIAEHPYNHTFINNSEVLALFQALKLLRKN